MPSTNSQDARVCRLSTPLPPNTLVLVEFSGAEYVNEITVYTVRALAEALVDTNELLAKPMQINIVHADETERIVHLLCFGARYLGRADDGHLYEFELRPWFWMMNYHVRSRIFHDQTIPDILNTVLSEHTGATGGKFNDHTHGTARQLEYVVQYCESDLAFCRRLMEEIGINFHIEYADGEHKLVMTSDAFSFPEAPCEAVHYLPHAGGQVESVVSLQSWHKQSQVTTDVMKLGDFNFLTPAQAMEASDNSSVPYSGPSNSVTEYPGRYKTTGEGTAIARRRFAGLRSQDVLVLSEANHAVLSAGMNFELGEHADDSADKGKYNVLSAQVHYTGNAYRSGGSVGGTYHSNYVFSRQTNPLAPRQITPRPRIVGPQTAIVVEGAETGEEHSRIKVQFHWEPGDTSMYARVAQMWAGKNWGSVFIPRVGMEVVVEFLDGDPDRPIITGCVYNADNTAPWHGLNAKHISGIKSQSLPSGGYNEISLNDKAGEEKILIHAQMDMDTTVENNEKELIRKDADRKVEGKQDVAVIGNSVHKVDGKEDVTIQGAYTLESMQKITLKVGPSSIEISPSGIKLNAPQIEVMATAALKTNGLVATHEGGATMIIKAPIVQIN